MTEAVLEKKTDISVGVSTADLQEMVSKAVKVCSFIEAIPLTCYLQVIKKGQVLTVKATDNNSTIILHKKNDLYKGPDMDIMVNAKLFSALVMKLSAPLTEFFIDGSKLRIHSNGDYDLDLIVEEDGSTVSIPDFQFDENVSNVVSVESLPLRSVLTMSKSCKADMKETPTLYNYYMDSEKVLTTDSFKACKSPVVMVSSPTCIGPDLLELVPLVMGADVKVKENANTIKFYNDSIGELYGRKAIEAELKDYPVEDIMETLSSKFPYTCCIDRMELIKGLERICLFTEGFDNNSVLMTFNNEQVVLSATRNNTHENQKYKKLCEDSSANGEILVDGNALLSQLNALTKEDVTISFGTPDAIQITTECPLNGGKNGQVIQILSGLDSEEEEMI